jgi:hypothetical protein
MCVTAAVRGACATMVAALAWGEKTMSPIARQDSREPPLASTVAGRFEECAAAAVRGTRGGARAVPGGAWGGGSPRSACCGSTVRAGVQDGHAHPRRDRHLRDPQRARRPLGVHRHRGRLRNPAARRPRRHRRRQPPRQGRHRRHHEPSLAALARTGPRRRRTTPRAPLRHRQPPHTSLAASAAHDHARLRAFFAAHQAANKPLWVTEFGYPSDRAYQYDRVYRSGPTSQASYLSRALPALLDGGAAKVFVTLRDNLAGQFASEGIIAGAVTDPPQTAPLVVRKPAFTALRRLANTRSW